VTALLQVKEAAAMIARAGLFHLEQGRHSGLDLNAYASLPLPGLIE